LQARLARAIGEIGLDYHDFSPRDVQMQVFQAQVQLARTRQPVVIHTREADEDTLAILREDGRGRRVCCTVRWRPELARAVSSWDSYVSLAGIITFQAGDLRETVRAVPVDRLLTETDSPFRRRSRPAASATKGAVARVAEAPGAPYGRGRARPARCGTSTRSSARDKVLPETTVEKSPLALAQIFEPIRADLEQVDREFARHAVASRPDPENRSHIQTSGASASARPCSWPPG
jgi:Tat protein secretion system quality control protein TatD with DNase activity